jgi:dTMP kinase
MAVERVTSRGRFITLEGGEGAGKSTQLQAIAELLRASGMDVVATREPGGAAGADVLRSLLLSGDIDWSPQAETLLHFAARAEHVAKTIRPALQRGTWVVCDRYYDSTMVYQGLASDGNVTEIAALSRLIGLVPDLTLILDVSVATTQARLASRGNAADRYERLGAPFFARVRDGFLQVARDNPERCVLLDANLPQSEVSGLILAELRNRFPDLG